MPVAKTVQDNKVENDPLRSGITAILNQYIVARTSEPFDSGHYLWNIARDLKREFQRLPSIRARRWLLVRQSFGQGAWARIPWLSLLDERETNTTSKGVYVIYLFRQDMSGVYLTLNQGVTQEKQSRGAIGGRAFVRENAYKLRGICDALVPLGFSLKDDIDLHSNASLGADYQLSTIAHKFYRTGNIPADASLASDLQHLLKVYDAFLLTKFGTKRA